MIRCLVRTAALSGMCAAVLLAGTDGAVAAEPPPGALSYVPPVRGPIVRHFEPPPDPYAAGHRGIDIGAPAGSEVVASAAGTVAFAGQVGGSLYVSIDHSDGIRTTYSFLGAVSVRAGQAVAQGERIAVSGPGHPDSTQPVLHFGARVGEDYLDPEALLVARFRHDYSGLIRLAPVEDPRSGAGALAPGVLLAGLVRLSRAARASNRTLVA